MTKEAAISRRELFTRKFIEKPNRTSESLKIPEGANYEIFLGLEEELLKTQPGLSHFPDGHTSFEWQNGQMIVYLSADGTSYRLEGKDIRSLRPTKKLLSPNESAPFGKHYRGLAQVLPGRTLIERIGIVHLEEHVPSKDFFKQSIGVVLSKDNGLTWDEKNMVQIIKKDFGPKEMEKEEQSGAGQPSAFIKDREIYLYYSDGTNGNVDSISLSTASPPDFLDPKSWKKYSNTVVDPKNEKEKYAASPAVSFNKSLGKYLMVYRTAISFHYADSENGIDWSKGKVLYDFKPDQDRKEGDMWYGYPTLISPSEANGLTTSGKGWLLCARGVINREPHSLIGFPFELTRANYE